MNEPVTSLHGLPRVGPYELLRRIGVGGMATVYLARKGGEAGFTRIYALKVMHRHLATQQELVSMLMDEAKIAARITHPNVVSTVDLGHADGAYYIALEYVDGVALDQLLARKPNFRPCSMIIPIAMDALAGLRASHELRGADGEPLELVHRDVTPGNIIVSVDGCASITDFGTAKARARATKTMPGIIKGKVGYVAPEVVFGRAIDPRADIFSMGVLLWNALTGETLYNTDDIAMNIHELVSKPVPAPSEVGLRPSPLFDMPILTALAREPDDRFENAQEMFEALEDALTLFGGEPPRRKIGEWVETSFARLLQKRRELMDPDIEVQPVEPSSREDPTVPYSTVPAEPTEHEVSAPDMVSVDETDPAFAPPPITAPQLDSLAPSGPVDAPSSAAALEPSEPEPRRRSRALVIALVVVVAFALGVGGGVLFLFLLR